MNNNISSQCVIDLNKSFRKAEEKGHFKVTMVIVIVPFSSYKSSEALIRLVLGMSSVANVFRRHGSP